MPQRVAQGAKRVATIIGVGGTVIAYLSTIPQYIGLTPALNIFNTVLLSVLLLFLWLLHRDLEEMNGTETSNDGGGADSNHEEDLAPDGGISLSPALRELQEESPEGGGALAGLIAGGALGLLAGPAGVVLGGLAGGVLGNEAEYQQIVDRYREALGKTGKDALAQEGVYAPRPHTVDNIDYNSGEDTFSILIQDGNSEKHEIILDLDAQSYTYTQA